MTVIPHRYSMQTSSVEVPSGNYYTYPKALFHSVVTTDLAVTLCEKHNFEPEKPVLGVLPVSGHTPPVKGGHLGQEEILRLARTRLLETP
jgi:hypothetical protein